MTAEPTPAKRTASDKPEKIRCDACPVMCYIAEGKAGTTRVHALKPAGPTTSVTRGAIVRLHQIQRNVGRRHRVIVAINTIVNAMPGQCFSNHDRVRKPVADLG